MESKSSMAERFQRLLGVGVPDEIPERVVAFRIFFTFYLLTRDVVYLAIYGTDIYILSGIGVLVAFVMSWSPAWRLRADFVALGCVGTKVLFTLPASSNHLLLELVILSLLCLLHREREFERYALIGSYRWLVFLLMAYSGLQKVAYGTYFDGSFLATQIDVPRFAEFFERVLSDEEVARIRHAALDDPPGPFRFESAAALFPSNSAWIVELAVAAMLLMRRLHALAVVVGLVSVMGIELVAREFLFGTLAVNMLMFFARAHVARRVAWVSGAVCVLLVALAFRSGGDQWFN
jgi:hypothetical protein